MSMVAGGGGKGDKGGLDIDVFILCKHEWAGSGHGMLVASWIDIGNVGDAVDVDVDGSSESCDT